MFHLIGQNDTNIALLLCYILDESAYHESNHGENIKQTQVELHATKYPLKVSRSWKSKEDGRLF